MTPAKNAPKKFAAVAANVTSEERAALEDLRQARGIKPGNVATRLVKLAIRVWQEAPPGKKGRALELFFRGCEDAAHSATRHTDD